jgi:dTMP kinase
VLIAIEGIDGAGKTTIARFLEEELKRRGYKAVLFKEPTSGPWGKKLKESYKSRLTPAKELELFILDRKYDVEKNIAPALEQGKIVIMDRYYYSTIAYQGALGFDVEEIRMRNEEIAPKPDLVIILDISPEKSVRRISKRGEKPNRFEDIEYLKKVREIFLSDKLNNVIVINAEQEIEKIKRSALNVVLGLLK